jgi:TonB-dependent receptor-like protein
MTASYPAEFGRKLGGIVDVVTRAMDEEGLRGRAAIYGGSDATVGGSGSFGIRSGRYAVTAATEIGRTDRFLDPPVEANYTNDGRTAAVLAGLDATVGDRNRLGATFRWEQAHFSVPNEGVQQAAVQRQARRNGESAVQFSYQRIVSTELVTDSRGMIRDIGATLTSNAASTPIVAGQDRGYLEGYVKSTVSLHAGSHDVKAGGEADLAQIREAFTGHLNDPSRFPPGTPVNIRFAGRSADREYALFAQDLVQAGRWTVAAGLRWDKYDVLVHEDAWSPRLGVAYDWTAAGLIVRASYDRVFQTPAFENLLVSSAPDPGDFGPGSMRLPVRPSRGHFLEAGLTRALFGTVRADMNLYRRTFTDYADDELLLNTGIGFPISFSGATINGFEARIYVPHWRGLSGSFSYSLLKGVARLPVTGGLFLASSDGGESGEFPITQDQRHTITTRWRYQVRPSGWLAAGASYGSGLPTEVEGNVSDLLDAYGAEVLERVDFEGHRVKPWMSANLSAGATLRQHGHQALRLQADVTNVFGRLNVINFAGLFSGTAVGAPRRLVARLQAEF